jgi:hypothetical protein
MWRRRTNADDRDYGISSDAMIAKAILGIGIKAIDYPVDQADLDACQRCYDGAPEHLKVKMIETLNAFRDHLKKNG